ncbi:MAG: glutamine-synthetase adenylyltransferase [Rhodobacteraceae bacterium]|nr:glutamine-synthetase adenylyltransferase [Paracoccaceae bacterium]
MSTPRFADAIIRLPLPFEPERAEDVLSGLDWAQGELRALLFGAAGCSPYLAGLIGRQRDWLETALAGEADAALAGVLDALAPGSVKETGTQLRIAKQRVALLVALADLGGVWPLDKVTGGLTRLADTALDVALKSALMPDVTRGRLPGAEEADLADACGLFALAMGKMGAFELNYSSDIDLICLFDDSRYGTDDLPEIRAAMVKAVRRAMALLSDITDEGYVFRTDLRLRPDPSVTPVAISISAAERYYEGAGRTWERAAFVKARPCSGAVKAGRRFLKEIRPFIWRRHLDFATVEEIQDIRKKIRSHKGSTAGLDGRNLKLGLGGIREIEFFAQTGQLIAGGRDPDLRVRETRRALSRLAAKGWVKPADAEALDRDYVRLREIEHRMQMVQDAQTHHLPKTDAEWMRLAMFCGGDDVAALQGEMGEIFERVHALTEGFFAPERKRPAPPKMSETGERLVEAWQSYPALRSERARQIFDRLLPRLLHGFDRAARPDEAIIQFDSFLKGLPAGVQVFSLFEANPQLIELMVDISSTAPALARYLADNPGVLDAVIGGAFFEPWPGREALAAELAELLGNPDLDYEMQLDAARHWQKDWHFRIGVHHLRGLIAPDVAGAEYADLAQATLAAIWQATLAEFARRHGHVAGRGAVVLGMGSLGARSLTAGSDLDLIVIYDAEAEAESDGRKALPARTYYARLTKALVTALSAQTAAGTLYAVDMRLRPSGRQGPAATPWSGYQRYQREEAWTWEHLALTRARVVAGEAGLSRDVEAFRQEVLSGPRDGGTVTADLAAMRARLAAAKPRANVWDISNGPGGLQDIELFAQAVALLAGSRHRQVRDQLALKTALADPDDMAVLAQVHALQAAVKAAARLLTDQALDPEALGHGGQAMLLRDTGQADLAALQAALEDGQAAAGAVIDTALAAAAAGTEPTEVE